MLDLMVRYVFRLDVEGKICMYEMLNSTVVTLQFAVCLGIIFILEIAGGIAGFVLREKVSLPATV